MVPAAWPGSPGTAGAAAILAISLLGCTARPPVSYEVQSWELAEAAPAKHVPLARTRVSYDRPLPAHVTQRLCDQYSLVSITEPADWDELCRRLHLPPGLAAVDLSQGIIVGILANVGEPAHGHWPLQIRSVRTQAGEGSLEADFASGLYYPLLTAGYLELVYVPGLRTVRIVRIAGGSKEMTFVIRSAIPTH